MSMSCDCCSTSSNTTEVSCPGCAKAGERVEVVTVLHQISRPWQERVSDGPYFFCHQVGCNTVYFTTQGESFTTEQLRQGVGQKATDKGRMLCYCFDVRYSDLRDADAARACREFVIAKTRAKLCACEERNPSGRCCLRDFPKEEN